MALQDVIDGIDKTIAQLQADRARVVQQQQETQTAKGFATSYRRFAFSLHAKKCPFTGTGHSECGFVDAPDHTKVDWTLQGPAEYLRQAAEFVQLVQQAGGTVTLT